MNANSRLIAVTQALADPLRLALLQQLMGGPASVSELVALTGAAQPNISNHLALLRQRGLVRATRAGRQSVYELRDATVGQLIESLALLAGPTPLPRSPEREGGSRGEGEVALRRDDMATLAAARTCYDHLAGRLGVGIFDALISQGAIAQPETPGGAVALGTHARAVFGALGIDLDEVRRARRRFATGCLDWTERRPHLGGALGAAVWREAMARGWVERQPGGRAVRVTAAGQDGLGQWLDLQLEDQRDARTLEHASEHASRVEVG
jgi:DNA-binding transcriptional ArsR family regulator